MTPILMFEFWAAQIICIPILGLLLLGWRRENDRKNKMLDRSLRALAILAVARGNRRGEEP